MVCFPESTDKQEISVDALYGIVSGFRTKTASSVCQRHYRCRQVGFFVLFAVILFTRVRCPLTRCCLLESLQTCPLPLWTSNMEQQHRGEHSCPREAALLVDRRSCLVLVGLFTPWFGAPLSTGVGVARKRGSCCCQVAWQEEAI